LAEAFLTGEGGEGQELIEASTVGPLQAPLAIPGIDWPAIDQETIPTAETDLELVEQSAIQA
jgi:hypothetical protein